VINDNILEKFSKKKRTVDKVVKKDISSNKHSEFLNKWCR